MVNLSPDHNKVFSRGHTVGGVRLTGHYGVCRFMT